MIMFLKCVNPIPQQGVQGHAHSLQGIRASWHMKMSKIESIGRVI